MFNRQKIREEITKLWKEQEKRSQKYKKTMFKNKKNGKFKL